MQTAPAIVPSACVRGVPVTFDFYNILAGLLTSQSTWAATPWLLLTDDALMAAVQKHVLQLCRRYLKDNRSAHLAVHLVVNVFRRSFAGYTPLLSVALNRPSLFLDDYQFIVMVVCIACVQITAKLESQVPAVHLTTLLHDYLQQPFAIPTFKQAVVKTESEILKLLDWDVQQPSQLALAVMEEFSTQLHSDHPSYASVVLQFVNRVEDSLLTFVTRHRTTGSAKCWESLTQLLQFRAHARAPPELQSPDWLSSAEKALVQIVLNSPFVIYPLVSVRAAAQILRQEDPDAKHVLKAMSVVLPDDVCRYFGNLLQQIADNATTRILRSCDHPSIVLPDFALSMNRQHLSTASATRLVRVCLQACTKVLVSRLQAACGRPGKTNTTRAPVCTPALTRRTMAPTSRTVTPPAAAPPMFVTGQKMPRDEFIFDQHASNKRLRMQPGLYPSAFCAFTPMPGSPTGVTTSVSATRPLPSEYPPSSGMFCTTYSEVATDLFSTAFKSDCVHSELEPHVIPLMPQPTLQCPSMGYIHPADQAMCYPVPSGHQFIFM